VIGQIGIENGVSRLDGLLMAVQDGQPNAITAATRFIRSRGFDDGDRANVSGAMGELGETQVFFITDISSTLVAAAVVLGNTKAVRARKRKPRRKSKIPSAPKWRSSPGEKDNAVFE
jgi:hypothetical protein